MTWGWLAFIAVAFAIPYCIWVVVEMNEMKNDEMG